MARPKVSFTLGSGGLGRPLTGFDHYSAMIAYDYGSAADSDYASIGDKIYTSIEDAEADGVVDTCAEATAATSTQTVTGVGSDGDTITITMEDWLGNEYTIGSYTKVTADSTVADVATAIVAAINALTYITGFSATANSDEVIIAAPKSWGVYPNTKETTNTIVGTLAVTNAAFTGGTKSQLAMYHYQISEFFRANPLGKLYFSIIWDDSAQAATAFNSQLQDDGLTVQNAFNGQARQILVYNPGRAFATSSVTACNTLRDTLFAQYTPAVILYFAKNSGALSALSNLRSLTAKGVGYVIGQSGSGVGLDLSYTQQTEIGSAGLALGTLSAASVSQNIGEVQAFDLSDGVECETAHFFDRTNYETISSSLADQLHDYGYIYILKYRGLSGSYFNSDPASVSPSSDYAYLSLTRTIDKAVRNVYTSILPLLNSKNRLNSDGTLSEAAVASYNEKCENALDQMVRDEDLSDYVVLVDREEVVSSSDTIPITLNLQPVGIARTISITIGFVATI